MAQIQTESVDIDELIPIPKSTNQLWASSTGALWIVKIDTTEYELDSLSFSNIDADWIQSIQVFKDDNMKKKYGYKGKNGVAIIRLKTYHIDDFLEGTPAKNPLITKQH